MTPIPSVAADQIRQMVQRLVERFRPEKVILFGSHARGEAGPDSDVDLLVVMPISGSRRLLGRDMTMSVAGLGVSNDIVVVSPEELERDRDQIGTVIRPAVREGLVLHERPA